MKQSLRMISVLAILGLISGASLAFVYKYASPVIALNQKAALEAAIFEIFPDGVDYEIIDQENDIYVVFGKSGNSIGYAFTAKGNGYQGEIKLMVGLKKDLETATGIEVLDSQETPGLGGNISGVDFKKQFVNLKVTPEIVCLKEKPTKPNEIQAITAATISSKSVVNIINKKTAIVRKFLENQ